MVCTPPSKSNGANSRQAHVWQLKTLQDICGKRLKRFRTSMGAVKMLSIQWRKKIKPSRSAPRGHRRRYENRALTIRREGCEACEWREGFPPLESCQNPR